MIYAKAGHGKSIKWERIKKHKEDLSIESQVSELGMPCQT